MCQEVKVDQGHKLLLVKKGNLVELSCQHYTETNYAMYWYQQKEGKGLQLMVYSTDASSGDMEDSFKTWTFNRPHLLNSTLSVAAADIEHSAVYFCAETAFSPRCNVDPVTCLGYFC
uniref:Ig-like domain-containing protein n=1 Tax=Pyxicephalus adspersus TaxID=30357 RepID=A0AAV2ZEX8_PYXAD|nr:TPA: hypothetical protein GDO54_004066 [Pyxicephalus adspersus]